MTNPTILTNTESQHNHLEGIKSLLKGKTGRLVIASPFLAQNIKELLKKFDFSGIENIELITTFKPNDPEQLTKPLTIRDFFEYFQNNYPKTNISVHIDNNLHGKLYIHHGCRSKSMILTSANFTHNGLSANHEWGLLVTDDDTIDDILSDLFESIEYQDVTYSQIKKACLFSDQNSKLNPHWTKKTSVTSDILEQVYSIEDTGNTDPQYFIKPVGVTENPVLLEDKTDFSKIHENLHFSKKKPKGVRKGDVLITVAVTAGALLSYYKVTGDQQEATDEEKQRDPWKERWPWYMEGRNQSQAFGAEWWQHNIQKKDVLNEFLEKNPNIPVTHAGGYSLGTLNFGADKVRITKEFGEFLISKIERAVKNRSNP